MLLCLWHPSKKTNVMGALETNLCANRINFNCNVNTTLFLTV
nr:hypothetical protein [Orientia tsutsugamushi]